MAKDPISGWEKLAVMATLIEAVVVILSISLIKNQLDLQTDQLKVQTDQFRLQTDLARAANIQSLAALSIPMNLEEVRSDDVTKLVAKGSEGFPEGIQVTDAEAADSRYKTVLANWLIFYENVYYQNSQGLIDPEMYVAWHKDLEDFIALTGFKNSWEGMKHSYHEGFRNHIDELMAQSQSRNQPPKEP